MQAQTSCDAASAARAWCPRRTAFLVQQLAGFLLLRCSLLFFDGFQPMPLSQECTAGTHVFAPYVGPRKLIDI